jgi:acetylornithine deacetylase
MHATFPQPERFVKVEAMKPIETVLEYLQSNDMRVLEIAQELIRFDTVFLGPGSAGREEGDCQRWIGDFLQRLGFEVDQWEPDQARLSANPMYVPGLSWEDRPITVATLRGNGGGRSLILNGHIDTVSAEPLESWDYDPWGAEVEGDRLYGRGSCDMKGGIAAALAAVEAMVMCGVELPGDLIVQTVTDEETTGMGTIAAIERGYRADACLVPEPSGFDAWVAYRGILYATITVTGRSAHAEIPQPHHTEGGGVSAIEAMRYVMAGIDCLNREWEGRPDKRHKLLATPKVQATGIRGGEFIASVPASCTIDLDLTYLPANVDETGFGAGVRNEVEEHLRRWFEADTWLRENPPEISWHGDYPAAETDPDHPFVHCLSRAAASEGAGSKVAGLDSWADAASYLRADVPALCYGPGSIYRAHTSNEWVSISELRTCSRVFARLLIDWCSRSG